MAWTWIAAGAACCALAVIAGGSGMLGAQASRLLLQFRPRGM